MTETILSQRYSTARPLDLFAQQFVRFLDDYAYINYNVETNSEKYLKSIKVYNTSDRFWTWLLDTRERKMAVGDPGEYSSPPSRETIDAISIPPVAVHRTTAQRYLIPPEAREAWHRNTYPAHLAHEFAKYDALIFMHKPDRWAKALTREKMAPAASKEDFEWAKAHTIAEAPYKACAHECLHLIQKITGGEMPQWDPASGTDPVEELFDEFLDQITLPVFEQLYVNSPSPQADKIDL